MLAWCMFHNPVHYRIGMLDVKNKAKKKKSAQTYIAVKAYSILDVISHID